jgi:hypothetical protein
LGDAKGDETVPLGPFEVPREAARLHRTFSLSRHPSMMKTREEARFTEGDDTLVVRHVGCAFEGALAARR